MTQFRTTFTIPPAPFQIRLQTSILSIGSCFAHAMGQRLQQNKFTALVNPFGVIFNPLSVFKLLEASLNNTIPGGDDSLTEHQGIWYHYDVHSDFWADEKETLGKKIQTSLSSTLHFLKTTKVLILTFGTAYGYFLKKNNTIVANCHKVPQKFFEKRLLNIDEIVAGCSGLYKKLKELNPDLRIIVTVSPVRHIKDTVPLNQVSKSILRVACHQITQELPDVTYFPAYELLLDDLRDYRFFEADMIHPTPVAENYVWDKFVQCFMDADTQDFMKQWRKIIQGLSHRSFHPESEAHQKFLKKLLEQLKHYVGKIDVQEEIKQVGSQLL